MSKLHELHEAGQSVWLDFIRRDMLENGELDRLVADGVRGLTSNPTIFQKAIAQSTEYDAQIRWIMETNGDASNAEVFELLAVQDIQAAADALLDVYTASDGADGFVSYEVSPHLAYDTDGTIEDAKRLWGVIDRPNLMIKVPATPPGILATEELLASGMNVNNTLMFSLDHYEAVAQAYRRGVARASDPAMIASVASFFVSRVDSKVDAALEKVGTDEALELRGRIAVANSKLTYRRYKELFQGEAFAELADQGATPQRVLWASTSTKNPEYNDVLYVEELIGPNTVNTMPPATIDAFRDHGVVRDGALSEDLDTADAQFATLADAGVHLDDITEELQEEGVASFSDSYDDLLTTLGEKIEAIRE